MDIKTIILTAMFTGIGVSLGNAFYELILKEWVNKIHEKKKNMQERVATKIKSDVNLIKPVGKFTDKERKAAKYLLILIGCLMIGGIIIAIIGVRLK